MKKQTVLLCSLLEKKRVHWGLSDLNTETVCANPRDFTAIEGIKGKNIFLTFPFIPEYTTSLNILLRKIGETLGRFFNLSALLVVQETYNYV